MNPRSRIPTSLAAASQGTVGTEVWHMRQIVPIFLYPPAQAYNNYNIQLLAACNGWAIKITDVNFNQVGPASKADYGDLTG